MNTGGDRATSMIFDMLIHFSNAAVGMTIKDMVTHAPHISQGKPVKWSNWLWQCRRQCLLRSERGIVARPCDNILKAFRL
jgi:hypothetical protein